MVARFLIIGVFLFNISAVAFVFHWLLASAHCSYLLFIAHCSLLIANCQLYIRPQKKFPGTGPRAYRICNTVCDIGGLRRGKVSPGEAPEGPASPKGFTGWDGPGKSEADFSSGEQTVDGNSYPYCRDDLRCMTEKMQEVARPVPPGGAFQGGSLQGLSQRWKSSFFTSHAGRRRWCR